MIDWNSVIKNLKNGNVVTVDPERWNMSNPEYAEMLSLWQSKNFNIDSVRWVNYYNFDDIQFQLGEELGVTPLRSWISCVEPGYMTGYHYDIDDNEKEYLKLGELKRYSVFVSDPDVGHLFILGKDYYFNKPQGSIIKCMFHLLGY
jgi:hypothetical protein